jgi:hypothetical protein
VIDARTRLPTEHVAPLEHEVMEVIECVPVCMMNGTKTLPQFWWPVAGLYDGFGGKQKTAISEEFFERYYLGYRVGVYLRTKGEG